MIKEELEKEAEEYLKKKNYTNGYIGYFASGYCERAYIDGAEPREKRIAELEIQIEKMKCCSNCRHYQYLNDARDYTCVKDGKRNGKDYRSCRLLYKLEKWELM